MKYTNNIIHLAKIFGLFLFILSCKTSQEEEKKLIDPLAHIHKGDLADVLERGKLIVLTENSANSYFIYKGAQMGLEYEILKYFAKHLNVSLEMKVVKDLDHIIEMLNSGDGDLIACNYTITKERQKEIDFSIPIMKTAQVLVQRKPDDWRTRRRKNWKKDILTDPGDLIGKTVHVWGNSSYYKRLIHLQEELGDTIFIKSLDGDIIPEEIIGMVANGTIDYTVTDKNVALINQRFYPNVDAELEVSVKQRIGIGVRKTSPNLRDTLNAWLESFKTTTTFRHIKHKYLKLGALPTKSRDEYSSIGGGKISPFDDIIREVAQEYSWDWRFLAALIYQESKFVDHKESWAGAYGLMQFMPQTGPSYGVFPDSSPKVQIQGGMKKIIKNWADWEEISDSIQRLKFTIASYNAGLGHVQDAQRLTEKNGLDHHMWDDNVEDYILKLSKPKYHTDEVVKYGYLRGIETYSYVRKIFIRYNEYKNSFDE